MLCYALPGTGVDATPRWHEKRIGPQPFPPRRADRDDRDGVRAVQGCLSRTPRVFFLIPLHLYLIGLRLTKSMRVWRFTDSPLNSERFASVLVIVHVGPIDYTPRSAIFR